MPDNSETVSYMITIPIYADMSFELTDLPDGLSDSEILSHIHDANLLPDITYPEKRKEFVIEARKTIDERPQDIYIDRL